MASVIVYLSLFVLKMYAFYSYNIVGYCFVLRMMRVIPSVFRLAEIVFDDRLPQIKNTYFLNRFNLLVTNCASMKKKSNIFVPFEFNIQIQR